MTQFTVAMKHWRSAAFVALAAMTALTAMNTDAAAKKARQQAPAVEMAQRPAGEPIMAIVSIKSQTVTFYDADGWILRAPVSTGVKGRETPAGVFAVLEKDEDHHSSLYDDAWMPHMQRITWNGIALHGGPLPGYAASHGCIRMPYGFAEDMFDRTRIGMRVIISPNDAAPVAFSHPVLFQPDAAALASAPVRAGALDLEAAEAAKAAAGAKKAAAVAAGEAAAQAKAVRKLERAKSRADGELAAAEKAIASAIKAKAKGDGLKEKAMADVADLAAQLAAAEAEAKQKSAAAAAAKEAATDSAGKKAAAVAANEAASAAKALRKLERAKTRADANLAAAEKAIAAALKAKARGEERKEKAAASVADLTTQLDLARSDATAKADAAAAAKAATEEAAATNTAAAEAAREAKLAVEPVSVYISRATGKLYVRRNTHEPIRDGGVRFDSTIEVPVTIRDPDQPIGTHIFTAMAEENGGLRWTAVTIDEGDGAGDALDRVAIPQEVLDIIAPTALPRSSIIISDEPLSKETNYRTEFVAVLSDYPQGGFITRKPAAQVRAVKRNDGGFFSQFGRNTGRRDPFDWLSPPRR